MIDELTPTPIEDQGELQKIVSDVISRSGSPLFEAIEALERPEADKMWAQLVTAAERPAIRRWIRRRTDTIEIVDERQIKRRCDLEISTRSVQRNTPEVDMDPLLPVQRISRTAFTELRVRDSSHHELPRLLSDAERFIVFRAIVHRYDLPREISGQHVASIWTMLSTGIAQPPHSVGAARTSLPPLTQEVLTLAECLVRHGELAEAKQADFVRDMVKWCSNLLVIIQLPITQVTGSSILISIEFRESIPRTRPAAHKTFRALSQRFLVKATRFLGGSFSAGFVIPLRDSTGGARSTHTSVLAPDGFRIVDARLDVDFFTPETLIDRDPGHSLPAALNTIWKRGYPSRVFRDDDAVEERSHIHFGQRLDMRPLEVKDANLVVSLYAYRTGVVVQTWLASLLIAFVTTVYFIPEFDNAYSFKFNGLSSSANFAAELIPALLSLSAGVLIQRDPNRAASRCLSVPRSFLSLSAVASLIVALLLTLTSAGWGWAWWLCEVITGFVAIRLTVSLGVTTFRISRLRKRWKESVWFLQDSFDAWAVELIIRARDNPDTTIETLISTLVHRKRSLFGELSTWQRRLGLLGTTWTNFPSLRTIDEGVQDRQAFRNLVASGKSIPKKYCPSCGRVVISQPS